jgi:RNA polymerase sigma-70 factor, ECF subfamily
LICHPSWSALFPHTRISAVYRAVTMAINCCDPVYSSARAFARDDSGWRAFQAANEMLAQRVNQVINFCRESAAGADPGQDGRSNWELFFRAYAAYIRRVATYFGVKFADLDDCCQEAWIEVVKRLAEGRYDPTRGSLAAWIFAVVRNKSIDFLRALGRNPEIKVADLDFLPTHCELDPAVLFERKRRQEILESAIAELINRLSATTFEALYQTSIEERDGSSVARELGLTLEQLRYRRRRAKQSLRELLGCRQMWSQLLED